MATGPAELPNRRRRAAYVRRTVRWRLLSAAAILAGIAGWVPGLGASDAVASTTSPSALLTAAIAAGDAQSSVHWTSTTLVSDGAKATSVADATTSDGTQQVVLQLTGNTGHAEEVLVGHTAYVKGDGLSLTLLLGLTQLASAIEAGHWIAITPSSTEFVPVALGLTVRTTMSQLEMTGSPRLLPDQVVLGQRVIALSGKTKPSPGNPSQNEVLYVRATGRPLPVEERETTSGSSATMTFSSWGERVTVPTPKDVDKISPSWIQKG